MSQLSASYARQLADHCEHSILASVAAGGEGAALDGVVAIAHAEASGSTAPNNYELLLRTLW